MKVEWLNASRSKARLTRGWFRKRQAEVYESGPKLWYYESGEPCSGWLDHALNRKRARAQWTRVASLPKARVVA